MMTTRRIYQVLATLMALAILVLITAIARSSVGLNATTVALLYLMVVLPVSAFAGYAPGFAMAMVSGLLVNYYFLPPYGTLYIESPEDWVSFGVYTISAFIVSYFVVKIRQGADEARALKGQLLRLSRFSESIKAVPNGDLTLDFLAVELRRAFGLGFCAIYNYTDNITVYSGVKPACLLEEGDTTPSLPSHPISYLKAFTVDDPSLRCLSLYDQGKNVGALLISRVPMAPEVEEQISALLLLYIRLQPRP